MIHTKTTTANVIFISHYYFQKKYFAVSPKRIHSRASTQSLFPVKNFVQNTVFPGHVHATYVIIGNVRYCDQFAQHALRFPFSHAFSYFRRLKRQSPLPSVYYYFFFKFCFSTTSTGLCKSLRKHDEPRINGGLTTYISMFVRVLYDVNIIITGKPYAIEYDAYVTWLSIENYCLYASVWFVRRYLVTPEGVGGHVQSWRWTTCAFLTRPTVIIAVIRRVCCSIGSSL